MFDELMDHEELITCSMKRQTKLLFLSCNPSRMAGQPDKLSSLTCIDRLKFATFENICFPDRDKENRNVLEIFILINF